MFLENSKCHKHKGKVKRREEADYFSKLVEIHFKQTHLHEFGDQKKKKMVTNDAIKDFNK